MVQEYPAWASFGTGWQGAGALAPTAAAFTSQGRLVLVPQGRSLNVYRHGLTSWPGSSPSETTGTALILQRRLQAHEGRVTGVDVLAPVNVFQAVSASLDGTLRVWDLEEGTLLRTIDLGVPLWRCLVDSQQGRTCYVLASASDGTAAALAMNWSERATVSRAPIQTQAIGPEVDRPVHMATAASSDAGPASSAQPSGSNERKHLSRAAARACFVARVDLRTGRWKTLFQLPFGEACMDLSADGQLLVASSGNQLYVWRSGAPGDVRRWEHTGAPVTALSIDAKRERVAVGDSSGVISVYQLQSLFQSVDSEQKQHSQGAPLRQRWHWHARPVRALCFGPGSSSTTLFSGGHEGVLVEWHLHQIGNLQPTKRFYPRLGGPIQGIAVEPQTQTAALTLYPGSLIVVHLPSYSSRTLLRTVIAPFPGSDRQEAVASELRSDAKTRPGSATRQVGASLDPILNVHCRVQTVSLMPAVCMASKPGTVEPMLVYSSPDGALCVYDIIRDSVTDVLRVTAAPPVAIARNPRAYPFAFHLDESGCFLVTSEEKTPLGERWLNMASLEARTSRQVCLRFWCIPPAAAKASVTDTNEAELQLRPCGSVTLLHRDPLVLLAVRHSQAFSLDCSGTWAVWQWSLGNVAGTPVQDTSQAIWSVHALSTTKLRCPVRLVAALLTRDASLLVTLRADGVLQIFAVQETLQLVHQEAVSELVHHFLSSGDVNGASQAPLMQLDALEVVASGQLLISVRGERMPPQLVVYDMARAQVRWRLVLAADAVAALTPTAALATLTNEASIPMDVFAVALASIPAVLLFRALGEPTPMAIWRLPSGTRPRILLTHPLVPLAVLDDDAHLHLPEGPLDPFAEEDMAVLRMALLTRSQEEAWRESQAPSWFEQLPTEDPLEPPRVQVSPQVPVESLLSDTVPAFMSLETCLDALLGHPGTQMPASQTAATVEEPAQLSVSSSGAQRSLHSPQEPPESTLHIPLGPEAVANILGGHGARFRQLRLQRLSG